MIRSRCCVERSVTLFICLMWITCCWVGEDVNEIFDTLEGTGEDFATARQKLKNYFATKKNTEYEVYKFRQAKQSANETIDSFHTRLRQLAHNCEFTENDREVKSQIIQGCQSTRLRRKALREDLNLELLKFQRNKLQKLNTPTLTLNLQMP
jgi:hypothetical protein